MRLRHYRELKVWQIGMDLVGDAYRVGRLLPRHEAFALVSQLQRAAVSIPTNIAEGYARTHRGDCLRSLSIANGSLKESETLFLECAQVGLVDRSEIDGSLRMCDAEGRMLASLIRHLRSLPPKPDTRHPKP